MSAAPDRPSLLRSAVQAFAIALAIGFFGVSTVRIDGASMQPTLRSGERALVPRYETWLHRLGVGRFQRGDIVYFPAPDDRAWHCPLLCGHLIKRIVALPGETVALERGVLRIDGRTLDEPWLGPLDRLAELEPVWVPAGTVFVLGDNRGPLGSVDSRAFGPVPLRDLGGRAALVVWPPWVRDGAGGWRWNLRRLRPPPSYRATWE